MNAPPDYRAKKSSIGASTLGIGIGTAIILFAQSITPPSDFAKWLLVVAPALAVGADKISALTFKYVNRQFQERAVRNAQNTIKQYLTNKETSDSHKENLRRKLEELEIKSVESIQTELLNSENIGRPAPNNLLKRTSRKRPAA